MKDYGFLHKALFTFDDVLQEGLSEKGAFSALFALKKKGKIIRLRKGLYATINPISSGLYASRYEIGSAIHPRGVIAYRSAMQYYGFGHQLSQTVQVIVPVRYQDEEIEGTTYRFFLGDSDAMTADLFGNAPLRITELERTVIDCLDRPDLVGGVEELWNILSLVKYLNEGKVIAYLALVNRRFLYKKAGFIFEKLAVSGLSANFYELCLKKMSKRHDDIRDQKYERKGNSSRWNLTYPAYMDGGFYEGIEFTHPE